MSARFCSSCGAPLVSGDQFCSSCGARVVASAAKDGSRRNPLPSPTYAQPVSLPPGSPDADPVSSDTPGVTSPSTTVIQHVYVPAPPPKKSHAGAIAAVVIIVLLLVFLFLIPASDLVLT